MPTISQVLGYPDDSQEPVVDPSRQPTVTALLTQLAVLDQAIQDATLDSMAVQLGETRVDYGQHLVALRSRGTMLLKELSDLTGLQVRRDKYSLQPTWSVIATG